jgi:enamine deaminase RidA (YjgF/YER057c/UK114 family)
MATKRFINPSTMSKPVGFSHVVDISGPGRIIYVAGQLGIDADGKIAGSLREQIAQAFENVREALSAVGAGFKDITKLNVYLVNIQENIGVFRAARDEILKLEEPPVSTAVGVPQLARAGTLVEIEAIAFLEKN